MFNAPLRFIVFVYVPGYEALFSSFQ